MRNLVPIKVKILRSAVSRGMRNLYPKFNDIDKEIRKSLDWSSYFDSMGIGWHYSNDGFGEGDEPEVQYGATCVPADFASEAVRLFPDTVTEMTEAEWETFYEDDFTQNQLAENVDTDTLQGILARVQLEEKGIIPPPSAETLLARSEALDPESPKAGISKNRNKKWADVKARRHINIVSSQ